MIEMSDAAAMFKVLGDPTRLQILRNLGCCPETINGPTASEVCCQVTGSEVITSTISHHLKSLREAGLIKMERHGKTMCCELDPEGIRSLASFLENIVGTAVECCPGDEK